MKTHASNGIGPLVREYVHERNAARKAGEAPAATTPAAGTADTVEFSAAALARFEAWKAKHSSPAPEVTEPEPDPVTPGTEPPATEPAPATDPIAGSFSILV